MKKGERPQIQTAALQQAIDKISKDFLPCEKHEATIFWTTLKFSEAIEQISGKKFKDGDIITELQKNGYQNTYMENIGLIWWVKIVE